MCRVLAIVVLLTACGDKGPPFCSVAADSGEEGSCPAEQECVWEGEGNRWRCMVPCASDEECPEEQTCSLEIAECPLCEQSNTYCNWQE